MLDKFFSTFLKELPDAIMAERLNNDLEECGAFLDYQKTKEHYELVSEGMHSGVFYHMKRALQHHRICQLCAFILSRKLMKLNILKSINVIVGPRRGAGPLMQTLAFFLPEENIRTLFMDPCLDSDRNRVFRLEEHALLTPDDQVLLVDDALTTGKTIRLCIAGCEQHVRKRFDGEGAHIAGVAVVVNRAPEAWKPKIFMPTIPIAWAIRNPLESYWPMLCPFCQSGIPLIKQQ